MVSNPRAGELRALVVPLEKVKNVDKNGAIKIREGVQKTFFFGDLSQMCLPIHPPQGFYEIWENERCNSGRKRRFSG